MASPSGSSWAPNTWFATNSTEQNGTFQLLATGTQDLAALVALFVTGSVERFAFDSNNGLLAAAVSPCSLLGILGYCQGLMKLGLGFELCESLGFKVDALRSHFGYLRSEVEYLQRSEYVAVHHLSRTHKSLDVPQPPGLKQDPPDIWNDALIRWQTSRTLFHKNASWALARGCWHKRKAVGMGRSKQHAIVMCMLRPPAIGVWPTIAIYSTLAFLCSMLSSSIILFADHKWTWSRIIATFGLAAGIASSFTLWMIVYVSEQIPRHACEWFEAEWCPWPNEAVKRELSSRSKLGDARTPRCSFFKQAGTFYLFRTSMLTDAEKHLIRLCSFALAMLVMLGYICQYVELRRISSQGAAVWLICQLSLAAVRVLVWTASSKIHILNNHCLRDFTFYWPLDETISTSSLEFEWSMTEIELACLAIDQHPLFPSDGATTPWGRYNYEDNDTDVPLEYTMHWLMGHLCAIFEAPKHLSLPPITYEPDDTFAHDSYINAMRTLTSYDRRGRCDPMVKLWLTYRCADSPGELFQRLESSSTVIEPWLFFNAMPYFKIAFCLHTFFPASFHNDDMTVVEDGVNALFAVISEDPDEVVVLLQHRGYWSCGTWLTRASSRPKDVLDFPRCSQAADKVFEPNFLGPLKDQWDCFTAEAARWTMAQPHQSACVQWAVEEAQKRWRACNANPHDRNLLYPYSWQEVMERHGKVSNVRSFAVHRTCLKKVQNILKEVNRRTAVWWQHLIRRTKVSRRPRINAIGSA